MSEGRTMDVIRWTFTPDPARAALLEEYLTDLGADVSMTRDGQFTAVWEEPEGDLDRVVEELWAIHGEPFDVTHEEFCRLGLYIYGAEEDDADQEAA
jgi:hypothetical protein